jgi:hypothetical protein
MTVPVLSYTPGAAGRLSVDLERIISSRALIQANSGGGKSWALRQLLEETHGRVPHLVLDPEGEFYTLREKFDYTIGAKHGADFEATPRTAKLLCRRLVENGASAVLDLYELKLPERREFVRVFLEELVNLPRSLWQPYLVVLDEAHMYAPERSAGESSSTEAVIALASLGRKRGFALVCATQRLSKLHKDVAAELNTKLIGRTGLDVDMKRAGDELGMDKEHRAALQTLGEGEFFAYGPAIGAPGVTLVRTGAVTTSHPQPGQLATAAPPPSKRIAALISSALADLPTAAAEEAKTIEDLKRVNAELARKLRAAEKGAPEKIVTRPVVDGVAIAKAVDRMRGETIRVAEKRRAADSQAMASVVSVVQQLGKMVTERLAPSADRLLAALQTPIAWPNGNGHAPGVVSVAGEARSQSQIRSASATPPVTAPPRAARQSSGEELSKGERMMLTAIAQHDSCDREQLSILTGYKRSTRDAYLQRLIAKSYVGFAEPSGLLIATDEGLDALGDFAPLPTGSELREHWLGKLPEGESKVLAVVVMAWPDSVPRETVGGETGYKRSTRDAYLQRLLTRKLIETVGRGEVRARDMLFDEDER